MYPYIHAHTRMHALVDAGIYEGRASTRAGHLLGPEWVGSIILFVNDAMAIPAHRNSSVFIVTAHNDHNRHNQQ